MAKSKSKMVVKSKEFRELGRGFSEAEEFATRVGPENLINISVYSSGKPEITWISVWYWVKE